MKAEVEVKYTIVKMKSSSLIQNERLWTQKMDRIRAKCALI